MSYDLRHEPWIPFRRRDGAVEWASPVGLVDAITQNPVIALASPRPDFDGALEEFLIGLLAAALAPQNEADWRRWWERPPTPDEFRRALDALPPAFDLDGDGPRFFQDFTVADFESVEIAPVDRLLIETPGDQGVRLNKDLFVKRARAERLCRPAAAMALLTLQTYAPGGGQGHRTSVRGGGPLTTLVDPRVRDDGGSMAETLPLWRKLWANVETCDQLANRGPGAPDDITLAFPWLSRTRTSNPKSGGVDTTPSDAHPLQAYFGLPRRIRLEFDDGGCCDLTGRDDTRTVVGFRMINYGVKYEGWEHPLSPYYRKKPAEPWLPIHGQPEGVGWRDWATLALDAADPLHHPARAVADFNARGYRIGVRRARLRAFGYDMDNMKARGWVDTTLPVFVVADRHRHDDLLGTATALTEATREVTTALWGAVKDTLFHDTETAAGDISSIRSELWSATEGAFYDAMSILASPELSDDAADAEVPRRKMGFRNALEREALVIFDRWCPAAGLKTDVLRRRVAARYNLVMALRGYSKLGERVFAQLGVPLPGGGRTARASKRRAQGKGTKKKSSTSEQAT